MNGIKCSPFLRTSVRSVVAAAILGCLLFPLQGGASEVMLDDSMSVSTESSGMKFEGWAGVGYLSGEAHEYVYWPSEGDHTASELIWEIDSLYMFGTGGSLNPLGWLKVNADLWFVLADGSGYMEDYDWIDTGNPNWTHQSIHPDTDVTQGFMFDVNVEMTALSTGSVSFVGIGGFRHDVFEWEARGGTYIYTENSFRDTSGTIPDGTLGITYEQVWDVFYVGMGFDGDFNRLHMNAKFTYSPFVSGEATDQHHLRNLVTYDDFTMESMWAITLGVGFDITERLNIAATYFYENYGTMTGDATWHYNDTHTVTTYTDAAGASLETSMLSARMTYTF